MITIFICKDDSVAKEITKKYLDRETLPYVNMLEGVTYDQAVRAIEVLEKEEVPEVEDDEEEEETLEDKGWQPIAVTEEGLQPAEDAVWHSIGYQKKIDGRLCYKQEMRMFSVKGMRDYIEKNGLTIMKESAFNKKF